MGQQQRRVASPRVGRKVSGGASSVPKQAASRRVQMPRTAAKESVASLREAGSGEAAAEGPQASEGAEGTISACFRECARDGEQDPHCYHRCLEGSKRATQPSTWGSTRRFLDDLGPPPRSGKRHGLSRPSQRGDPVASRLYTPATVTHSETDTRPSAKDDEEASETSGRPSVAEGKQA